MASNTNQLVTNPQNRSFFLRKPVKTTVEQEQALRDQLHIEIENKSKACSNSTFDCSIPRIEGYEYCIRHILQDPRSPFKQCAYTYASNGKRCLQPAPKYEGKKEPGLTNYCFEHSRLIQLTKTRSTVGKYKQVETNEAFLNDLTHHIKIEGTSTSFTEADEEIDVVSPNADPFIHYVHSADFDYMIDEQAPKRRLLDYASDSSSDEDMPSTSNTWPSHEWDNSDNESVDSQNEDLLKHAGIYTTEEATMITKQKMMRLQVLYMEQLLRLQHLLKEKRRKYLHGIKKERETLCSVYDQPKETTQERNLYRKLKTLNRYHKRFGMEAILYRKYKEKRDRATEGASYKPPAFQKCIFSEGGVKCGDRVIPSCKYCKKHILEDKKQVLFRACGVEKSGVVCQEPVPNIFEDATCVLHLNLPPAKAYTQKKFESETEEEEEAVDTSTKNVELKQDTDENATINPELSSTQVTEAASLTSLTHTLEEENAELVTEKSQDIEMISAENDAEKNVTISHEEEKSASGETQPPPPQEDEIQPPPPQEDDEIQSPPPQEDDEIQPPPLQRNDENQPPPPQENDKIQSPPPQENDESQPPPPQENDEIQCPPRQEDDGRSVEDADMEMEKLEVTDSPIPEDLETTEDETVEPIEMNDGDTSAVVL